MNPAIVVSAYNRPQALKRLLESLVRAAYPSPEPVPLVISIDRAAANPETEAVARQFEWSRGPKEVLAQKEHLGLVRHFYACGDLSEKYGAVIFLEDDLVISPVFYPYASQMLEFYRDDRRIAGVSLYGLWFNGYNRFPFVPYLDDADIFFLQTPYTQGEAFTDEQWSAFRRWRSGSEEQKKIQRPFHESWSNFLPDDWFPEYARYLTAADRFFVFPRASLSTGAGDAGTHFAKETGFFQAPLQQEKLVFHPKPLDESIAVYDCFFEMLPSRLNCLTDLLQGYDYSVDLYALKSRANLRSEYVLSSRPCRNPIHTFGKSMWPLEANIASRIPGDEISFCRTEDLQWGWRAGLQIEASQRFYFSHDHPPGLKSWVRARLARLLK